jgi:hypothetical protein
MENKDTACFKKRFTTLKAYNLRKFSQDVYSVLNCHNVAKHTEFCLTFIGNAGNAGCFKKSFTSVFQMLLCGECYGNVYTLRHTNYPSFNILTMDSLEYHCKALF